MGNGITLATFGARFGAQNINGKHYYFDPVNCDMKTGWISNPGYSGTEWNYYDPVSGEEASGWRNIDGKWYFLHHALKGFKRSVIKVIISTQLIPICKRAGYLNKDTLV